jgi:hypothetical protein
MAGLRAGTGGGRTLAALGVTLAEGARTALKARAARPGPRRHRQGRGRPGTRAATGRGGIRSGRPLTGRGADPAHHRRTGHANGRSAMVRNSRAGQSGLRPAERAGLAGPPQETDHAPRELGRVPRPPDRALTQPGRAPGQPAPAPRRTVIVPGQPDRIPGRTAPVPGEPPPAPGRTAPVPGEPPPAPGEPGRVRRPTGRAPGSPGRARGMSAPRAVPASGAPRDPTAPLLPDISAERADHAFRTRSPPCSSTPRPEPSCTAFRTISPTAWLVT